MRRHHTEFRTNAETAAVMSAIAHATDSATPLLRAILNLAAFHRAHEKF
jgi:DNA-binding FadR family transcriptional regulator